MSMRFFTTGFLIALSVLTTASLASAQQAEPMLQPAASMGGHGGGMGMGGSMGGHFGGQRMGVGHMGMPPMQTTPMGSTGGMITPNTGMTQIRPGISPNSNLQPPIGTSPGSMTP